MSGDKRRTLWRIPVDEVAQIVREWPTATGYCPHIAERWGVPITTARRWITEARRRGLLPPGGADRPCPVCKGTGVRAWHDRSRSGQ